MGNAGVFLINILQPALKIIMRWTLLMNLGWVLLHHAPWNSCWTHAMCVHWSYQKRSMLILVVHSVKVAISFCPHVVTDEPRIWVMLIYKLFAITIWKSVCWINSGWWWLLVRPFLLVVRKFPVRTFRRQKNSKFKRISVALVNLQLICGLYFTNETFYLFFSRLGLISFVSS